MILDYRGATARRTIDRAPTGKRWAYQPKIDGCYARLSTDSAGVVVSAIGRSGATISTDLVGCRSGIPDATLHGELEAHTEAGIRAARDRGHAICHLFDATRAGGVSLELAPYRDRLAALHLHQSRSELAGRDTTRDANGNLHSRRSGRYAIPRDLRRFPVVPTVRTPGGLDRLWRDHVLAGGGEGLVAVDLDGQKKIKIKATDTIDCDVIEVSGGVAVLGWCGRQFTVSARGKWALLDRGDIVEVRHDGCYEATPTPRFARIVRLRSDLR